VAGVRFLANMNISPKTIEALRHKGWDIVRVSQILSSNALDHEVLELARQEGRILVTQDLDFSALLALGGCQQPSVITLRLEVSDPETITRTLVKSLPSIEQALQEGCAVTIEDAAIRVRNALCYQLSTMSHQL